MSGNQPRRAPLRDAKNPLLQWPAADARQRIHIEPAGARVVWSFGPRDMQRHADTAGQALDAALERIGHEDAVIIYGGRG